MEQCDDTLPDWCMGTRFVRGPILPHACDGCGLMGHQGKCDTRTAVAFAKKWQRA